MCALNYLGWLNPLHELLKIHLHSIGIFNEFEQFLTLQYYFCSGVMLNVFKDDIKVSKCCVISLFLLLIIFGYFLIKWEWIMMVVLPYLTIVICCCKKMNIKIDISYEMYVVAFPLQQLIVFLFKDKINIYAYIIVSIVISIIFAYIIKFIVKNVFVLVKKLGGI